MDFTTQTKFIRQKFNKKALQKDSIEYDQIY